MYVDFTKSFSIVSMVNSGILSCARFDNIRRISFSIVLISVREYSIASEAKQSLHFN